MKALHQVYRTIDGEIFEGELSYERAAAHEREILRAQRMKSLAGLGYKEIDISESYKEVCPTRKGATLCMAAPQTEDDYKSILSMLSNYYMPQSMQDTARIIPALPCTVHFIIFEGYKRTHLRFVPESVALRFTEHIKTLDEKMADELKKRDGRVSHPLTYNGKTMGISTWAKELGVPVSTLYRRIEAGKSIAEVLSPGRDPMTYTHNGETKTINAWAKENRVSVGTLKRRLDRGIPFEQAIQPGRIRT